MEINYDVEFEQFYHQQLLPFVQQQTHASCFEMMKHFHVSYAETVRWMDALEARGIVEPAVPEVKGPRPLKGNDATSSQKSMSEVRKSTRKK